MAGKCHHYDIVKFQALVVNDYIPRQREDLLPRFFLVLLVVLQSYTNIFGSIILGQTNLQSHKTGPHANV